jgi:hypothetical protein
MQGECVGLAGRWQGGGRGAGACVDTMVVRKVGGAEMLWHTPVRLQIVVPEKCLVILV